MHNPQHAMIPDYCQSSLRYYSQGLCIESSLQMRYVNDQDQRKGSCSGNPPPPSCEMCLSWRDIPEIHTILTWCEVNFPFLLFLVWWVPVRSLGSVLVLIFLVPVEPVAKQNMSMCQNICLLSSVARSETSRVSWKTLIASPACCKTPANIAHYK